MNRSVEEIEDMRLKELRKQAAVYGPHTDPAVLIEIQELTNQQRTRGDSSRRAYVNYLDYEFLMNTVAAALVRLGEVEAKLKDNDRKRITRQLIHDIWMVAITVMMFFVLLMQLMR